MVVLVLILIHIVSGVQGNDAAPESVGVYRDGGLLSQDQNVTEQEKVKLQFYYESHCPYSILVYITQLNATVMELAPYLDITTYPYGNARMKLNGTQLTITCQHRVKECYGNMLHACAIDALKDVTKYVPFNACMMDYSIRESSNDDTADECGTKLNVDSASIKECAKGIRGFELLLHYGIESDKQDYQAVPWWYVNGVSKISGEKKTLKEILCDAFKNPPEVCKQI